LHVVKARPGASDSNAHSLAHLHLVVTLRKHSGFSRS